MSPACDGLMAGHTVPAHLQVEGLFWNYFSIGMDATAAYGFHHLRETKPWAAPSRMINQAWYAYYGCASGWFCCAKPIKNTVSIKVRRWAGLCSMQVRRCHVHPGTQLPAGVNGAVTGWQAACHSLRAGMLGRIHSRADAGIQAAGELVAQQTM